MGCADSNQRRTSLPALSNTRKPSGGVSECLRLISIITKLVCTPSPPYGRRIRLRRWVRLIPGVLKSPFLPTSQPTFAPRGIVRSGAEIYQEDINHPNKSKHERQALRHLFDAILSRMILIIAGKRAMSLLGEDAWLIFAKCFGGASSLRPLRLQSSFGWRPQRHQLSGYWG